MELLDILAKYPQTTLVFIGWPIVFVWLLWKTQLDNTRREERLLQLNDKLADANRGWQECILKVKETMNDLIDEMRRR